MLTLKQLTPVRMVKNRFFQQVNEAERRGATPDELRALLGNRRAKAGIFEGNLEEGELEIGQVVAGVKKIQPAAVILREIWEGYLAAKRSVCHGSS